MSDGSITISTKPVSYTHLVDGLNASKNQSDDIKAALEALKKDSGYLFEDDQTPPPYAPGPGKTQVINQDAASSLAGALRERYATKG